MQSDTEVKEIGSVRVPQYETTADLAIITYTDGSGKNRRKLRARYRDYKHNTVTGYPPMLPMVDGHHTFQTEIPDDWSDAEVVNFIGLDSRQHYPIWEVPARAFASLHLMRSGEMPNSKRKNEREK